MPEHDDLTARLASLRRAAVPPLADAREVLGRGEQRRARHRVALAGAGAVVVLATGGSAYGLLTPSGGDDALQPAAPVSEAPATPDASPSDPVPTTAPPPGSPTSAPSASASPRPTTTPSTPPPSPTAPPSSTPTAPSSTPTAPPTAPPTASLPPAATPSSPPATGLVPGDRLELTGIGELRVGMTYTQAERVTGRTASYESFGGCTEGTLSGGAPEVTLQGDGEVIQRIDAGPGVRTAAGVAIGDTEARVRQVYAGAEVRPSYYDPQGHWLVVRPAGSAYQLLFETDGTRVTALRTGLVDVVEAPEGCH